VTSSLVVLLRLQLGIQIDTADNAEQRIPTDTSVVVLILIVDVGIVPASSGSLPLRPPQQPTESVKVGTGRLRREPETRGHATVGGPEVDLLLLPGLT